MSLEAALAENTAALNKVAALLEQSNAGRDAAIEKLTSASAGEGAAATPRGRPSGAKNKPKEEAAPKEEPKPKDEPKAAPSQDDVRQAAGAYVNVADEKERLKRKEFLKSVVDHLGCKVVDCAEEDRAKVIGWFEAAGRGEKVAFSDGEDDIGADEEEDDIG